MKKTSQFERAEWKLTRQSQEIAERQARIPSHERLSKAITDYIEWHTFAYWARLAAKTAGFVSAELHQAFEQRCPGFLSETIEYLNTHPNEPEFLWLRLITWIDAQSFGFAKMEGWSDALSYYAARDLRMDRVFAYWEECEAAAWSHRKPDFVPNFDEWRARALGYQTL